MVNRCLETYLRCLTRQKLRLWSKWLSWAESWYNTNYHASLKTTPFHALYGRESPILVRADGHHSAVEEVNRLNAKRSDMLRELHEKLVRAQDVNRAQANKYRRAME